MELMVQSVKKAHLKLLAMKINTYLKPPPIHGMSWFQGQKLPPKNQQQTPSFCISTGRFLQASPWWNLETITFFLSTRRLILPYHHTKHITMVIEPPRKKNAKATVFLKVYVWVRFLVNYFLPWEPVFPSFLGFNPYFWGWKFENLLFSMVFGVQGSWLVPFEKGNFSGANCSTAGGGG